jgi:hypothetical protein
MLDVILGPSWIARFFLVGLISCMYAGAVSINNQLLFPWAEYGQFHYWLFLPAGLKLLFLMLFGWRAVFGIGIAIAAIALNEISDVGLVKAIFLGGISSLVSLFALTGASRMAKVQFPWSDLRWYQLAFIVVIVSLLDSMAIHLTLALISIDSIMGTAQDILVSSFARSLGTFAFLSGLMLLWRRLQASCDGQ